MKIWTYYDARRKVERDIGGGEEEVLIKQDEFVGYFNEALEYAENQIQAMNQDYLLARYYVPFVNGQSLYDLPRNIFANKIRTLIYQQGTESYPIVPFARYKKELRQEQVDAYAPNAWYMYSMSNYVPGQAKLEIHPNARETFVMPPNVGSNPSVTMTYIRNCARIPILGELCNPEVCAITQVNVSTDVIATNAGTSTIGIEALGQVGCYPGSLAYATGDQVALRPMWGGALPNPLVTGTIYYVIAQGSGNIKLATSLANARAGTAIDLLVAPTNAFVIEKVAVTADQDATVLDIPEFTSFLMQFVKTRIMEKEMDPRLQHALGLLKVMQQDMADTLSEAIQDDNASLLAPDLSHYWEMS